MRIGLLEDDAELCAMLKEMLCENPSSCATCLPPSRESKASSDEKSLILSVHVIPLFACRGSFHLAWSDAGVGSVKQKRLPCPAIPELSTQMLPPIASTNCLLI